MRPSGGRPDYRTQAYLRRVIRPIAPITAAARSAFACDQPGSGKKTGAAPLLAAAPLGFGARYLYGADRNSGPAASGRVGLAGAHAAALPEGSAAWQARLDLCGALAAQRGLQRRGRALRRL